MKWKVKTENWKVGFLLMAMLIMGGTAKAQLLIKGNVFGGGENAAVTRDVTVNFHGRVVNNVPQDTIKGDVYGGGGFAEVNTNDQDTTRVILNGGVVKGNIYGGGLGRLEDQANGITEAKAEVNGPIYVTVSDGKATNVFGCNNINGSPELNVQVTVQGGTVGNVYGGGNTAAYTPTNAELLSPKVNIFHGTVTGNVYGSGLSAAVTSNPMVTVGDAVAAHNPAVQGNVYGGGQQGAVNGNTYVNVVKGILGTDTKPNTDPEIDGFVFGGSEGLPGLGNHEVGMVRDTAFVTIGVQNGTNSDINIKGSVFGGGDDGQVKETQVMVYSGIIGKPLTTDEMKDSLSHPIIVYRGNVYGGGRGIDQYSDPSNVLHYDSEEGRVHGNTNVIINGGKIYHDVYGAGSLASVGTVTSGGSYNTGTGKSTVTINGGEIGMSLDDAQTAGDRTLAGINSGQVFGSGRGIAGTDFVGFANVDSAVVNITGGQIYGLVFGGGANGHVNGSTVVNMTGGTIGIDEATVFGNFDQPWKVRRGNLYGGGRGIDHDDHDHISNTAGLVYGNTNINISGNARVYQNVFGGGSIASVGDYSFDSEGNISGVVSGGNTYVNVSGGTIGVDGNFNGRVFGAGRGEPGHDFAKYTFVNDTYVTVSDTAQVNGSVFGSGDNGHTYHDTHVNIEGGQVGVLWTKAEDGNVFGGGRGKDLDDSGHISSTAGKVSGDTYVNITGGLITHMVYGGGLLAMVGEFNYDSEGNITSHVSGGTTNVTVSGGTIGNAVIADDNGHVFGAGRGVPGGDYFKYNYVNFANVIIKDSIKNNSIVSTPTIYGSVFGGGENGHVYDSTKVTIDGGTIGTPLTWEHQTSPKDTIITEMAEGVHVNRGNVYGGGRGIEPESGHSYSYTAGWVRNKTKVVINGGKIYHNVFGGGSLASVGLTNDPNTLGQTYVIINGGEIGMDTIEAKKTFTLLGADTTINYSGINSGQVFGGGRGEVSDPNDPNTSSYTNLAYVRNTNVTVNPNTGHIYGAVFGGGANGHVSQNTKVYIKGGTIGHPVPVADQEELAHDPNIIYYGNVYGGGRGIDQNSSGGYSSTAGKVFGNTEVEITGGTIYHCVYGGGSLANVGVDTLDNTGLAKVTVTGGTIGTTGKNNGSVFGGARGEAGGTFTSLAYVKNTQVVIGEKNGSNDNLTITGSVFGGGANGHVRKNTDVKLYSGTIGTPLTLEEMVEADPVSGTTRRHLFRGNVYGGGRGVDHDNSGHLSSTAGRVYGNTNVTIQGGKVYHCVYGGGSLASVGTYTENASGVLVFEDNTGHADVTIKAGEIGMSQSDAAAVPGSDEWHAGLNSGQVYGSGRGETGSTYAKFAFTNTTHVTIDSVANIYGAVFGGGANGHVEDSTYVEVKGGAIGIDDVLSNHFSIYRGNVYGGGRGIDLDNSGHISASAGQVYGNARVKVSNGNVYHNVFGGGSLASVGTYQGSGDAMTCTNGGKATVIIKGGTIGVNHKRNGCVYGSGRGYPGGDFGNLTYVNESYVYIDSAAYIKGDVFGSGDNGHVSSDVHVIMTGGTIGHDHGGHLNGNIYGGGRGVDTLQDGSLSLTAGLVRGDVYVNVSGGQAKHNVYGGGYMASVKGNTHIDISGNAHVGDGVYNVHGGMVFGGGHGIEKPYEEDGNTKVVSTPAFAKIEGNTYVNITGGTIDSTVYGGGRMGAVEGFANVTVNGGTLHYNLFGAGEGIAGNSPFKGDVKKGTVVNLIGSSNITGNVYGGGRNGTVGKPWGGSSKDVATVQVNLGSTSSSYTGNDTVNGSIFGGGMVAQVNGNTTVNINSGYVTESVYGGNQTNDTVKGNITVNVNKGTVNHDLFGGGLGQLTATAGNVTVNFGEEHYNSSSEEIHVDYPILNGDLYGGSAYGTVNDADSDKNTVNIINGNLNGDVYGGGLGDTITTPGDGHENIAALTYGQIEVNVGKAKNATDTVGMAVFADGKSVYGCNNINGTPKDNVFVNIYKTAHGADPAHNLYPSGIDWTQMGALANNTAVQTYAIRSVYGGGNKASYTPIAGKNTKVHVYTCVNTIEDVYGGGNAAHIGSSALNADAGLEIEGGRIKRIFGGGNGTVVEADIYGDATSLVHGGVINEAFGGSNEQGIITGTTALEIDSTGCDVFIGSVFGGGNNAIIFGDGELTILCGAGNFDEVYGGSNMADIGDPTHPSNVTLNIQGGVINKVFGGSKGRLADPANNITEKSANIYGNVTLNLQGGRIGHAYGGSNINGNVHGIITVNVLDLEDLDCPLIVDTIFGASNATPYTPDKIEVAGVEKTPVSPVVNVKHIRNGQSIQGCVFGGGNGTQAVVTSNPKVTIGDPDNSSHVATIKENVYGGGNQAQVVGDTHVILDGTSTVDIKGNVYGAGHGADVDGNAKVEVK